MKNLLSLLPPECGSSDGYRVPAGRTVFPITAEDVDAECILVSASARYEGTGIPTVQYRLGMTGEPSAFYRSHTYTVGGASEMLRKQWRFPPLFRLGLYAELILDVPEGCTLYLECFSLTTAPASPFWDGGPRHNAHLGFHALAPEDTMPACELAARCGFPACIVVPKVTKDGVLVFLHDETINRTARDAEGNPPDRDLFVSDMTYEELLAWDFGVYRSRAFRGTRLPKLYDFFELCAKTGMRPMFSTHPALTVPQWEQVREMLAALGIADRLHIKSFSLDILKTAYSVFGDTIDGYTWDNGTVEGLNGTVLASAACRVGIELQMNAVTPETVREIRDAGYFAAVWNVGRRSSEEYRRVMSWGVTEFTEDVHCSMGLNW